MALDAYDSLILAEPGIFAYYPNDETTGTNVADATAGGKTLVLGAGTTIPSTTWGTRVTDIVPFYTSGHQALDFTLANAGHASSATTTTGQPPVTTGMVIEAWVRLDSSQSTSPFMFGNSVLQVQQFNARIYGKVSAGTSFGNITEATATVYHIMLAWSGGASGTTNWTIYINGVSVGSGTTSTTSTTPTWTSLGGTWNGSTPFDGVVSRFAVYSGAGVYADAARLASSHYSAGTSGVPSSETHSGSAAVTMTTTTGASGSKAGTGTAALTVPSVLAASGSKTASGAAAATMATTFVAAGSKTASGTAALTTTVTLTASGGLAAETHSGAAAMTMTATLAAAGSKTGGGTAALSTTVAITAAGFSNQQAPVAPGMTRFVAADSSLISLTWAGGTYTMSAQRSVDIPTMLLPMVVENWVRAGILQVAT